MDEYIKKVDVFETLRKANISGCIIDKLLEIPVINIHSDTEGKVTERNVDVSRPDGNCLDCEFQYRENSDYWCSICPGNPEDI